MNKLHTAKNLIWSLLSTLLFPLWISDTGITFSNSVFSLLVFAATFTALMYAEKSGNKRVFIFTHILGFIFSAGIAFGNALDKFSGSIPFGKLIVPIVVFTHVIAEILKLLWIFLDKAEEKLSAAQMQQDKGKFHRFCKWICSHPVIIIIVLFLCWTPCLMAEYPGGFTYDARKELVCLVGSYSADYPQLHSFLVNLIIGGIYKSTGNINLGVTVFVVLQMILIASMYAHIICTFARKNKNSILLFSITLYLALFPLIQMLVVQETRDILFGALVTYTAFLFYLIQSEKTEFFKSIIKPVFLGLVLSLTVLARNNNSGIAVTLLVAAVALIVWIFNFRKHLKGVSVFFVTCLVSYIGISTILTNVCQPITPAQTGAGYSFASQALVKAYRQDGENWNDEDVERINTYIKELNRIQYCGENADPTKSRLAIDGKESEFMDFYVKIGKRYPAVYAESFLANTQNMWFPDSVIDGYNQCQGFTDYDKCYLSFWDKPEEPVTFDGRLPNLYKFYNNLALYLSFEKVPIISMLFSIGFQFWVLLNALFYGMCRKNKDVLPSLCILLIYFAASSLSPLVLARYYAAAFFAMPLFTVFTFQGKEIR